MTALLLCIVFVKKYEELCEYLDTIRQNAIKSVLKYVFILLTTIMHRL